VEVTQRGLQNRARQAGEKRERRQVPEQDVLQHVEAEELLTDRMDR
jgi:hypothetical protein